MRIVQKLAPGIVLVGLLVPTMTAVPAQASAPTTVVSQDVVQGSVSLKSPAPKETSVKKKATKAKRPVLRPGSKGKDVKRLQRSLHKAGYFIGKADGKYGTLTKQAVLAVQKSFKQKRTGIADAKVWKALEKKRLPKARTKKGRVIEVDLKRQIMMIVKNGKVKKVFNISSGNGERYWYINGYTRAITPKGTYKVYREVNGNRIAALGALYRPKYFLGGFAIHGSPSIPAYPASHGCVRISNTAMDWLWKTNQLPKGTTIKLY